MTVATILIEAPRALPNPAVATIGCAGAGGVVTGPPGGALSRHVFRKFVYMSPEATGID